MKAEKRYWIAGMSAVAVIAVATTLLRRPAPPENPGTPEEAVRVIASRKFQSLDPDQQQVYVKMAFAEKITKVDKDAPSPFDSLTRQQVFRLKENMGAYQARTWTRRVQTYHALPPAEKVVYLDRLIDEEEQGKAGKTKAKGKAPGSGDGKTTETPGKESAGKDENPTEWLKESIESTSPEERARSLEFKKAWRDRREQRGLEAW